MDGTTTVRSGSLPLGTKMAEASGERLKKKKRKMTLKRDENRGGSARANER